MINAATMSEEKPPAVRERLASEVEALTRSPSETRTRSGEREQAAVFEGRGGCSGGALVLVIW